VTVAQSRRQSRLLRATGWFGVGRMRRMLGQVRLRGLPYSEKAEQARRGQHSEWTPIEMLPKAGRI
jgi:hypothetical protein